MGSYVIVVGDVFECGRCERLMLCSCVHVQGK